MPKAKHVCPTCGTPMSQAFGLPKARLKEMYAKAIRKQDDGLAGYERFALALEEEAKKLGWKGPQ